MNWLTGPLSLRKAAVLLLICMLFQGSAASIIVLIATSNVRVAALMGLAITSIIFIVCIAWIGFLVVRTLRS